ncbi:MAG: sensor histidine kinase [Bdellovibrionales bacterium]|nr:sensor histidine kinase [Bdellovibrionales bacterium]
MKVFLKVGVVLLGSLVAAILLSFWILNGQLSHFQVANKKAELDNKLSLISSALELQSESAIKNLLRLASDEWSFRMDRDQRSGLTAAKTFQLKQSEFVGVFEFKKNDLSDWRMSWGSVSDDFLEKTPELYWSEFSKKFPWHKVKGDTAYWVRMLGPQRDVYLALLIQASFQDSHLDGSGLEVSQATNRDSILLGLLPIRYFERLGMGVKGTDIKVMVVNQDGFALLHPEGNYIGSNIKSLASIKKAIDEEAPQGHFDFHGEDGKGYLSGFYKVLASNLNLVIEQEALSYIRPFTAAVVTKTVFYAFGIWAIFFGILVFILYRLGHDFSTLKNAVHRFVNDEPIAITGPSGGDIRGLLEGLQNQNNIQPMSSKAAPSSQEQKSELDPSVPNSNFEGMETDFKALPNLRSTYEKLSRGLSESLRSPLASIIGHVQMVQGRVDQGVERHFQVIQEEARKAREIVDSLTKFGQGGFDEAIQKVNVLETVYFAKESVTKRIQESDIFWDQEVSADIDFFAQPTVIKEVLVELFSNAIDAASNSVEKVVRVSANRTNMTVSIVVENSGKLEGDLNKFLDPFYTTKDSEVHPGLGLSVVNAMIRAFRGTVTFNKSILGGLKVILELPQLDTEKASTQSVRNDIEGPIPVSILEKPECSELADFKEVEIAEYIDHEEWTVGESNSDGKNKGISRKVHENDGIIVHEAKSKLNPAQNEPQSSDESIEVTVDLSSLKSEGFEKTVPVGPKASLGLSRKASENVGPAIPVQVGSESEKNGENPLLKRRADDNVGPKMPSEIGDEPGIELTQPLHKMKRKSDREMDLTQNLVPKSKDDIFDKEGDFELTQALTNDEVATESSLDLTQTLGPEEKSVSKNSHDMTQVLSADSDLTSNLTEPILDRVSHSDEVTDKIHGQSSPVYQPLPKVGSIKNLDSNPPGLPIQRPKAQGDQEGAMEFPPTPADDLLQSRPMNEESEDSSAIDSKKQSEQNDKIPVKIRPPKIKD